MLDLDGDVVGEAREFAVQRLDDRQSVGRAIEEIGIAKGDVLGAGVDLAADVFEHDVALHDAENAVVNRHDRTMAAEMLAAAAGFRYTRRRGAGRPAAARAHRREAAAGRRGQAPGS